ncbi:alpha-ketoglutarate-dependent dioxygenase AlkB [Herbaspirillum sp. HC18]|nr:alpha-ketoglutarate-dependent dioxygenase AlkB [Herbaspirillum sp. HC18]
MPDADVRYVRGFYRPPVTDELLRQLSQEIAWRQETITLWGKDYLQPRLSAWYGDEGRGYSYSGVVLKPLPWTETLLRIKDDVEKVTGYNFNSVLLNLYRDEHDSVGWHSDAEPELGKLPVIASLSLGETRTFRLRHKSCKAQKPVSIRLDDGSLLLMAGTTQHCWQHCVPKESEACGRRINLTFRTILK